MSSGIVRAQPESARGTMGSNAATPMVRRRNPARMMPAGRLFPARFPASSATANMLSDSGAIESPDPIALYSRTIWRKIGKAIIRPPSEICWSI